MDERNPYLEEVEKTQDEIAFKRIMAWEVRRLTRQVEVLTEQQQALQAQQTAHKPSAMPWWVQAMLAVMISLCAGYIGLVHNLASQTQRAMQESDVRLWTEVSRIAAVQHQRTSIIEDLADLKRRILANESAAQRVPFIERQMQDIANKLDRIIERQWPRGGQMRPSDEGADTPGIH